MSGFDLAFGITELILLGGAVTIAYRELSRVCVTCGHTSYWHGLNGPCAGCPKHCMEFRERE